MYDQILNLLSSSQLASETFIAGIIFMILASCILIYRSKPHMYVWHCLTGLTICCGFFLCILGFDVHQHQEISQEKYTQLRSNLQTSPEYAPLIAEALRADRITNAQFDELQYGFANMGLSIEKKHLAEKISSILQTSPSSK
jgi:Ca2+/Na+ antiporter